MLSLFQRQPLIGVLAVAAAGLAVVIGFETGFGVRLAPSIPAGTGRPAAPFVAKLLPPFTATSAEQAYPEMVARPLFVPLRRPAPAPEAAAQSVMKRGQYVLQGVTIAGDTRIALLKEKATGHIVRVEKGHEVNGMKLSEVNPEAVTLSQGSEQEVLPLQVVRPGPPAVAPNAGPFGAALPGAASPAMHAPGNPVPAPPGAPGFGPPPPGTVSQFGPAPNPATAPLPQASSAPLTPEELLARRRARRAQ
jgi:hypothetical protein